MTKQLTQSLRPLFIESTTALEEWLLPWTELATNAVEANVFYEPWFLIPALRHLRDSESVKVMLIVDEGRLENGRPRLCGVFPIQRISNYRKIPLVHYQLWQHPHCYFCTPLIRKGVVNETIRAACESVAQITRGPFVWNWVSGNGVIAQSLKTLSQELGWTLSQTSFERAILEKSTDYEEYLKNSISGRHRREFGRLEKRLSELGNLEYTRARTTEEIEQWIQDFLTTEAAGWKGQEGTAMNCNIHDRDFFTEVVRAGYGNGKVLPHVSRLDGKAVALKCDFITGKDGFSFKVAYNEEFSKYRPGILLELQNLKGHFEMPIERIDACAAPGSMIDRIWTQRRVISNIAIATRSVPAGWIIRAVPALKRLADRFRKSPVSLRNTSHDESDSNP